MLTMFMSPLINTYHRPEQGDFQHLASSTLKVTSPFAATVTTAPSGHSRHRGRHRAQSPAIYTTSGLPYPSPSPKSCYLHNFRPSLNFTKPNLLQFTQLRVFPNLQKAQTPAIYTRSRLPKPPQSLNYCYLHNCRPSSTPSSCQVHYFRVSSTFTTAKLLLCT